MTKVKICGITRAADAELAIELGADYLGFIFVKESPRYVTPQDARDVMPVGRGFSPPSPGVGGLKPRPTFVGVFRGATVDEIRTVADTAQLDMIQIHGEPHAVDLPWIQAFNVKDSLPDTDTHADYVLFDTGGGTGRTFDWSLLANYPRTKPFFLAGGITPDNVAEAIARTQPFAIDVASGVESRPGIKDAVKLKRLFEAIQR
jgi:phosphoribosylanthranilate isomerase